MKFRAGVVKLADIDIDSLREEVLVDGGAMFVLPRVGIVDRDTLLDGARTALPMSPPLQGTRSWDAFADSLWQGVVDLPNSRVVVVWPNARAMATNDLAEFGVALEVFEDVARLLLDTRATLGRVRELSVLVET